MTNSRNQFKVGDVVLHSDEEWEGKITEIALRGGREVCRVDWKKVPYHLNFTWHHTQVLQPLSGSL
jgi:hypothetical protein